MSIAQDLFNDIQKINDDLAQKCRVQEDKADFSPYKNAEDYYAGELAQAIRKAFDSYTAAESLALVGVDGATTACMNSLAGMSASVYAPVASALAAWMMVFQSYLNLRKTAIDLTGPDVIPV